MPESFSIEVDATKFKRTIANMPTAFRQTLNQAVLKAGLLFESAYKKDRLRGRPGVFRRTGNLSQKFFKAVAEVENGRALVCGFAGVPYAAIQEFGGTVTAKKGKYLAIPVGPALTPSGVAKGPPRTFPNLRFQPMKGRPGGLLVDPKGKVYFVLKASVYVPPRLAFYPSFTAHFAPNGPGRAAIEESVAQLVATINGEGAK